MTKGNDGRAARKLLIQRLSVVLVAFLVCIACLHSMGIGKVASLRRDLATSLNMQNANALRTKLKEGAQLSKSMFKKFAADQQKQQKQRRKQQQQQQQQQQKQTQQTKDPQIIRVTFDDDTESEAQQLLLNAQVHLVAIDSSDPKSAVFGDFCTLNFAVHKSDPSSVPMFRHLVEQSPDCAKIRYRVNLRDYVQHATQYDQREGTTTKSLNLTAVVFHESRCGSTLVSNALVAMNPAKHRVYSESGPPIDALKSMCGETYQSCSLKVASKILQDVMFAMGRTQDPAEERVFFKIQSMGTRNLKVFQHAYPKVPFLFVYRDPVQVMMSQLSNGNKNANCVRPRHRPPSSVSELCSRKGLSVRELSDEEYCAAHLVSFLFLSFTHIPFSICSCC